MGIGLHVFEEAINTPAKVPKESIWANFQMALRCAGWSGVSNDPPPASSRVRFVIDSAVFDTKAMGYAISEMLPEDLL